MGDACNKGRWVCTQKKGNLRGWTEAGCKACQDGRSVCLVYECSGHSFGVGLPILFQIGIYNCRLSLIDL